MSTLNDLSRVLHLTNRTARDIHAITRGKIVQRIANRIMGRAVSRIMARAWFR